MAARRRRTNGSLEGAMALLVKNWAALVAQNVLFLREMAEMRNAVPARHESKLERLVETLRDKIGFKP